MIKKNLFGEKIQPGWMEHWEGMPEFKLEDCRRFDSIHVHFRNKEDRKAFLQLVGGSLDSTSRYVWYPKRAPTQRSIRNAPATVVPPNKYPIYVISKGRWETRLTIKVLEKLGIAYHVVVEPQEYDQYAAVIDPEKILTLPFSNLGQGSIPARNWVWEHSLKAKAKRHWIVDDNLERVVRLNNNARVKIVDENPFIEMEKFTDRFSNIALSGPNYQMFADQTVPTIPAYYLNTRVYSFILIKNDLPYRWRGRYNEDTDLSLRALKDGYCTVLFNSILVNKITTMLMKGGNTDELYQDDGRLKMAQSLKDQHPNLVKIVRKWGRWQHSVNYRVFQIGRASC